MKIWSERPRHLMIGELVVMDLYGGKDFIVYDERDRHDKVSDGDSEEDAMKKCLNVILRRRAAPKVYVPTDTIAVVERYEAGKADSRTRAELIVVIIPDGRRIEVWGSDVDPL